MHGIPRSAPRTNLRVTYFHSSPIRSTVCLSRKPGVKFSDCPYYENAVTRLRPILDRLSLLTAGVVGRFIGRPSEALLSKLASTDRPGASSRTEDSPMVAASHHIQLGQSAFASGAYGEALHCFSEAIKLAPNASWAWHGRGDALQLSGDHQAALEAYEKAISCDENCGIHHAGKANSLAALGRTEESEQAWSAALERDPTLTWMREGSKKP